MFTKSSCYDPSQIIVSPGIVLCYLHLLSFQIHSPYSCGFTLLTDCFPPCPDSLCVFLVLGFPLSVASLSFVVVQVQPLSIPSLSSFSGLDFTVSFLTSPLPDPCWICLPRWLPSHVLILLACLLLAGFVCPADWSSVYPTQTSVNFVTWSILSQSCFWDLSYDSPVSTLCPNILKTFLDESF